MLISVIIPTYNVELYIEKAIQSVLDQDYDQLEIIVIDDCSSDRTVELVQAFQEPHIQLFRNEKNYGGPSHSRNFGIDHAKGEWIAILDGDDWWDKRRLSSFISYQKQVACDLFCDDIRYIRNDDKQPRTTHFKKTRFPLVNPTCISAMDALRYDLGILKPIFRKSFLMKNGIRYNEEITHAEDFLILLECLYQKGNVLAVPEAFYYYHDRPISMVKNKIKLRSSIIACVDYLTQSYSRLHFPQEYAVLQNKKEESILALQFYRIKKSYIQRQFLKALRDIGRNPAVFKWLFNKLIKGIFSTTTFSGDKVIVK